MNRENFYRTVKKQKPERVPFNLELCESLLNDFYRRTGIRDYREFFGIPFRFVGLAPSRNLPNYAPYFQGLTIDSISEWGVGQQKGKLAHFSKMIPPMERFESPEQVWEFPLPDILAGYRWEEVNEKVLDLKNRDFVVVNDICGGLAIDIFEPAWYLRGMETLLMDLLIDEPMATACLDRMTGIKCRLAACWAQVGVDVIIYGDDVGAERSMMMKPEIWRKWLKPRLQKAIIAAKEVNPEVLCYYHSDGQIEEIIPDLIEIGVDILNPIQPECMDPKKIKRLYGAQLSFWGTIGTQTTMPFGSVADVRTTVREMIDMVGYDGGLILAPTHLLEPEVPLENVFAFVETAKGI